VLQPDIQEVLDGLNAAPGPPAHEVPVEEARAAHSAETERLCGPGEPVAEVRDLEIPGPGGDIPLRVFKPHATEPPGVVAYLHGGGWMMGTIDSYDTPLRALANASGAIVAHVDYRLAPEHRFPAGLDDSLAAIRWLAANAADLGGDPARLAVAGDSAGGNLAAVAARRLRGELPLRLQALVYPVIDARLNTPSYREFSEGHGLSAASMRRFWNLYLDGADGGDPDASPLRASDLAGVAPAHVLTAEADVLRDEGEAYAAALREAGVPTELVRWPGTIHGFFRWLAVAAAARAAIDAVGAALRQALDPVPDRYRGRPWQ
jgi:acetyl esterase/lipase